MPPRCPATGPNRKAPGHGQDRTARQRQPDHGNVEDDIPGQRPKPVLHDELLEGGAVSDQRLERQLAVQTQAVGNPDQGDDDGERREAPPRRRIARPDGCGGRSSVGNVTALLAGSIRGTMGQNAAATGALYTRLAHGEAISLYFEANRERT
jgi:hypothetical protein